MSICFLDGSICVKQFAFYGHLLQGGPNLFRCYVTVTDLLDNASILMML